MLIHVIAGGIAAALWSKMRDNLMPEEIEVDPLIAKPAFAAAHDFAIELARLWDVIDRKGEMEGA